MTHQRFIEIVTREFGLSEWDAAKIWNAHPLEAQGWSDEQVRLGCANYIHFVRSIRVAGNVQRAAIRANLN